MLSAIVAEATATRARRVATYTATTLGGAWLLGKYAVGMLVDGADRSRKEAAERHDLANRFGLALQDAQFTVLALTPTLATQLAENVDVEARSRELADLAKREREEKSRLAKAAAAAEAEEAERRERDLQKEHETTASSEGQGAIPEQNGVEPGHAGVNGFTKKGSPASSVERSASPPAAAESSSSSETTNFKASAPLSLNPAAPAFQPRMPPPTTITPPPPPSAPKEEFPALSNGHANGHASPPHSVAPSPPNGGMHDPHGDESSLANVGKSWAEIVKEDSAPSAENGASAIDVAQNAQPADTERGAETTESAATGSPAEPETTAATSGEVAEKEEKLSSPSKSKGELWYEIKTLSFTRLVTSIYVLVLLVLQTHVQLALLGRASYVSSLLSSLPPRTPSPPRHKRLAAATNGPPHRDGMQDDDDLEQALYEAKQLPYDEDTDEDAQRRDVERKYLTFSWWLLHEGWKKVEVRVREAVEDVVGSMPLKVPLVYGELGALFGEIRRRVDRNPDGSLFDFSSALHPPTLQEEIQTLVAGGSYIPTNDALEGASPLASTPHDFPPSPSTPPLRSHATSNRNPISPALRTLLHETSDALDSPDAALVRALSLDAMFALLIQRLEPAFTGVAPGTDDDRGARFEDVSEKTTRLASLLPLVTKLAGTTADERGVLSSGVSGNEFVEALEDVRELREFCAVLYGSWDTDNLRTSCGL